VLALLVAAGLGGAGCPAPVVERVVLVSIDTLRADHVGCYGADFARTPTLDRLAAEGVRFAAAISPAPLTLPAHTTLLTGIDPPLHGVRHNSIFRLSREIPTLAERMQKAGFATAAFVGAFVLEARYGLARGFDLYDDRMAARPSSDQVGYAERPANHVVDAASAWIEGAPRRFLLWVHFYDPHLAHSPPAGFAAAFAERPYDGEIAFVDAQIARLLAALERRFGSEGVLVVVTSDHGESLGEHGEPSHSYGLYDATQRVPLILRGPGLPAGRVVESQVRLQDVAPTLLARVGAEPLPGATGLSLEPLWRGREAEAERVAYAETLATRLDHGWSPLFAVRTGRFKYVRAPRPELFDLRHDPRETRNLAESEPARLEELSHLLDQHLDGSRPVRADIQASPEETALLERLGYVVPSASALAGDPTRVEGPDPKERLGLLKLINGAGHAFQEGRAGEFLAELDATGEKGAIARSLMAIAAHWAGDPVRGEREIRAALDANPGRADFLVILGQALEAQGRDAEARAAYEQARARQPAGAMPYLGLGRLAERAGELAAAESHFESALAAPEGSMEAAWRLAAHRLRAGRTEEADRLLALLPPLDRTAPGTALTLARAEVEAGLEARARARLAESLSRQGAAAPAWRAEAEALVGSLQTAPSASRSERVEPAGGCSVSGVEGNCSPGGKSSSVR
jgi:arylsulfatase A-like enzyme/Tfp pilus assembly protein PilF